MLDKSRVFISQHTQLITIIIVFDPMIRNPTKTILVLSANPNNSSSLSLAEAVREIDRCLTQSKCRDRFNLTYRWTARLKDVQRAILEICPHFVHFSGHGAIEKQLALEDETGEVSLVSTEEVSELFKLFTDHIECILLDDCYLESQAKAIAESAPYVIGLNHATGGLATREFTAGFYNALISGQSIDFAFRYALTSYLKTNVSRGSIPVLIKKSLNVRQPVPSEDDIQLPPLHSPVPNLEGLREVISRHDPTRPVAIERSIPDPVNQSFQSIDPLSTEKIPQLPPSQPPIPNLEELTEIYRYGRLRTGVSERSIPDPVNQSFQSIDPLSTEKIPQLPPSQPPIPNLEEFSEPLIPSKSPSNNEPPQLPSVSTLLKKPYESSLAYWLESGKDNSNLLTGLSLRQALRWSEQNQIDSQEQEFLSASIKLENQIEEKKLEEKNALNKLAPTYTTFKQLFNNNLMFLPIIIPVLIMLGSLMFWFRSKPALNDQQKTSDTGTGLGDINVSNNKKPILNQNLSENTVSDTNQLPQSNNSIGKTLKNSNIPSNASIPLTETRKINVSKIENQFLVQSSSVNPRLQRSSLTSLQPINTLNRIHLRSVSFSPGGKIVASSSWDKRVKLWDVATGRELKTFIGHQSPVRVVIFSPDGKTLASGSADRSVKLWDVSTGRELETLRGHGGSVSSITFSPDGKTLASGSADRSVKLWDVSTGRELETFRGFQSHVLNVSFSRNGKTLVSGSADRKIKFWDILVGREFNTFKWHRGSVLSVRFSPDGQTIASGSTDRSVKSWDMATGRELKTINGHQGTVLNVSFSPDGKTLVSGSTDKSIELWDVSTGQELRAFNGHQDAVYSVSFSPDGKTLVSGSADKSIELWDVSTGQELRAFNGHQDAVYSVGFSPDGKTIASGSADKSIKLWDVSTGQELKTLSGHRDSVYSVGFSPDGKTIASGSADKSIKLWDVSTGQELKTLDSHQDAVSSLNFSPDGKTLASGSWDKSVKLWDVSTGRELETLNGHQGAVFSVSFSPDGKILASGSQDKSVKLWNVANPDSR